MSKSSATLDITPRLVSAWTRRLIPISAKRLPPLADCTGKYGAIICFRSAQNGSVQSFCCFNPALGQRILDTAYAKQERRLNAIFTRSFRRILKVDHKDHATSKEIRSLAGARLPSLFAIMRTKRVRWLGHVNRTEPIASQTGSPSVR